MVNMFITVMHSGEFALRRHISYLLIHTVHNPRFTLDPCHIKFLSSYFFRTFAYFGSKTHYCRAKRKFNSNVLFSMLLSDTKFDRWPKSLILKGKIYALGVVANRYCLAMRPA